MKCIFFLIMFVIASESTFAQIERLKTKPTTSNPKPKSSSQPTYTSKSTSKVEEPKIKSGWTDQGLKGKVKSIRESSYSGVDNFGEIQKDTLKEISYTSFSSNGYRNDERDSDGNIIYHYDISANVEYTTSYEDGKISEKYINKYDEKHNEIEEKRYGEDGTLNTKWINTLDGNGNAIRIDVYDFPEGNNSMWFINTYDKNGNVVEETGYRANGQPWSKVCHKYNEHGVVIEASYAFAFGDDLLEKASVSKYTYEYVYDRFGNWTKRNEYANDGRITIDEREIVYY